MAKFKWYNLLSLKIFILMPLLLWSPAILSQTDTEKPEQEQDIEVIELEELEVEAKKPLTAFSDQTIRDKDFLNMPRQNPSDLMRQVPGMHLSQHTGGGKAHHFFLRGFDAEHGQDFAGYLDGIPLNEVSQVHGQGYLDLHFLIPESLAAMQVIKGPYDTRYGNFAVAGAVDLIPRIDNDKNSITLSYGSFETWRGLAQVSTNVLGGRLYVALEADRTSGFTDPGKMEALRGFVSLDVPIGDATSLRFMGVFYDAEYDAADVVPVRWVLADEIGRYDTIDDSDGGESYRSIIAASVEHESGRVYLRAQAYFQDRKNEIFSNYTYYHFHPQEGDQYELFDKRRYWGLNANAKISQPILGINTETSLGLQYRSDDIEQVQANTHERDRFNKLTDYDIVENSLGLYLQEQIRFGRWLQLTGGLRYDRVWYDVTGTQDTRLYDIYNNQFAMVDDMQVDAATWADVVSPKVSVVISPLPGPVAGLDTLDLFLNYGYGFYTRRAIEIARDPDSHSIPRAQSYEFALRMGLFNEKLSIGAGYWSADKEEELVFEPETGRSIPRGESEREGLDLELRFQPVDWLYLTFDYYQTRAEFKDSGDPIPGTPERMATSVISLRHQSGLRGSARWRWEDSRPLMNDDESREYWVADLLAAYERDRFAIELAVENLFDREWDDTSFSYTSRPDPLLPQYTGVHITPGTPQAIRVALSFYF